MTKAAKQISPIEFFRALRWINKKPLLDVVEPYRQKIFEQALFCFDDLCRLVYNLVLTGRAKKNWKSADLILAALYRLVAWVSEGGNQCYILASDLGQAADDLALAKKIVKANPSLGDALKVKLNTIERKDGAGFLEILPAQDVAGSHGKTYLFAGFDEIHTYRNWDLLEAMALDPSRPEALQWITSYASLFDRPSAPLHDLLQIGWRGDDPRMFFDWHSATRCTDAACDNLSPEEKANPSRQSWKDQNYLAQQRKRLPFFKYRRLHLNLGGQPEGSALNAEKIEAAIERGVTVRPPVAGIEYRGFVDLSGGSSDDACLGIAHREGGTEDGRAVLDLVMNQGGGVPFNPRDAVFRFVATLKTYGIFSVMGDAYAGLTFVQDFEKEGIAYTLAPIPKSKIYEALEPRLNGEQVVLLDYPTMESQFLGLVWRSSKIDHMAGEHDDYANAAAGAVYCAFEGIGSFELQGFDRPAEDNPFTQLGDSGGGREPHLAEQLDALQDRGGGADDPFSAW